jgi:hypothetical protein
MRDGETRCRSGSGSPPAFDAFCERRGRFAKTFLAIDEGAIVVMMNKHRTGPLWKLFMTVPEAQAASRPQPARRRGGNDSIVVEPC